MEKEKVIQTEDSEHGGDELAQQVVSSMEENLPQLHDSSVEKPTISIYKVPHIIRRGQDDAYLPTIVSIGPYHHDEPKLQSMIQHKWQYLSYCISRSCPRKSLKDYVDGIIDLEAKARGCYSEKISLDSKQFVELMVLDGFFILGLFLKHKYFKDNPKKEVSDPIFATIWMVPAIQYDLLMLENQLPFFILEHLFRITAPEGVGTLIELALHFLQDVHFFQDVQVQPKLTDQKKEKPKLELHNLLHLLRSPVGKKQPNEMPTPKLSDQENEIPNLEVHHLLHLFHSNFISTTKSDKSTQPRKPGDDVCLPMRLLRSKKSSSQSHALVSVPSASEMHEAGIEFKKGEKASSFLDIEFKDNQMIIPPLFIFDSTESLFRNLIAMEQCIPYSESRFTSYASFMDCLINTRKDVGLLYRKDIIEHTLGSDKEVALLFNRLCKDVVVDFKNGYLSKQYKLVTAYCKKDCNRKRAYWQQKYFSHPWSRYTLVAGIIVFLITIGQFVLNLLAKLH